MSLKHALARGFGRSGLSALGLRLQRALLRPHVRAVNYHDVPAALVGAFETQLRFYRERFEPVGPDALAGLLEGRWPFARPGICLTFDDGLRSHADVVAPLLEKHGFQGWFMVPVGFVDTPPGEQLRFAREHRIQVEAPAEGERVALSWEDLRRLDAEHVICCHTSSHRRLRDDLTAEELGDEIPGAKRRLEEQLGHEVPYFAWVGGEEQSYSAAAARAIREAGFRFGFMTNNALVRPGCDPLQIQRSNIEADFSDDLTRFTLSGFYDLLYWPKRRRVNALTAG